MKSEEINRLYKKLANLLHPDKLTDTSKQAEYLAAMKELITARKNKDIFELLTLDQRYFPNHDLAIDKKQEKQLSFALDKKLKELQDEYFIIYEAPTPISVLWRKFHDKNKRQQEYNLEQQKEWLNNMIKETDSIIRETSNVKNIKAFLRDHYESLSSEAFTCFQDEFISAYDTPDFDFDKPPF
jgi:curved DNA-binding protein CbpA